jgi:hypothetical protein
MWMHSARVSAPTLLSLCMLACLRAHVAVGYETMNEPSPGFIGCPDANALLHSQPLKLHASPTPFQTMALARYAHTPLCTLLASLLRLRLHAESLSLTLPTAQADWL